MVTLFLNVSFICTQLNGFKYCYLALIILFNVNQLEEINQKVLAKEGRLKRYRQRVKQYRKNRTFQNNERKFYQQRGGSDMKTHQKLDANETEQFWKKMWQPKKHHERTEWIKILQEN